MSRKKKRPWRLIAILVLIIAALAVWGTEPKQPEPPQQPYQLDKTGAGTIVDYTAACMDLHAAVDAVLAKQQIISKQIEAKEHKVPRVQTEGEIRWHSRHLLVEKPAELSADALINALQTALAPKNGKILAIQDDVFQGIKAKRLDIGLQEQLEQDVVTIISDKIFITEASRQQAKAKLAIIIDDFGYAKEPIGEFAGIKQPLTFSVLPYRPYSNEAAANALSSKHQVMLHMPMEPLAANGKEPVVISAAMNDKQIKEAIEKALATVPGALGINNHQGSKATADPKVMRSVMAAIKPHKLFFVDSRTTAVSVAAAAAKRANIPTAANDLFIDNDPDIDMIKTQLRQAVRLALKHGELIVIGHARPTTVIALREMLPEIEAAGVRLVFASQLVK